MRRTYGSSSTQPESNSYIQAILATGYVCRRAEEELERIGAATGGAVSGHQLGEWMGGFLLSKSQAHTNGLDRGQRVPEVRRATAEGHALGAGEEAVHVLPRGKRTLSPEAREAIARAQRERWRKQRLVKQGLAKPANWASLPNVEKKKWYRLNAKAGKAENGKGHPVSGVHWTQTPRGRAFMRKTARARFGNQAAPAKKAKSPRANWVPKGFWQSHTTKLLNKNGGQVTRPQLMSALRHLAPGKEHAIGVAVATMKHQKLIVEKGGLITLFNRAPEAATA